MSNVTKYKLLVKNLPMNFCQERLISVLKIHGITDIYKIIIKESKKELKNIKVILKVKTIPILFQKIPGSILSIKYYLNNQIDIYRLK
jgi:hypothetical protein